MKRGKGLYYLSILHPFWGWIAGLLCVIFCLSASFSVRPYALAQLIDALAEKKSRAAISSIWIRASIYILMSLLPVVMYRIHNFIWINLAPPLRARIYTVSMDNLLSRNYPFFQRHPPADLANRVKEIAEKIPLLIETLFDGCILGVLTLVIAMATVWRIDPKFAWGLGVWVLVFITGSIVILRRAKALGHTGLEVRSTLSAKMVEIIRTIKTVILYKRQGYERSKFKGLVDANQKIEKRVIRCTVRTFAFQGFSFVIYQGISLVWLIRGYTSGVFELGDFILILSINLSFVDLFRKITNEMVRFADHLGSVQEGSEHLMSPSNQEDRGKHTPIKGAIELSNISFKYKEQRNPLSIDSLTIQQGEKLALVGFSGSGKSTFVNLLARIHPLSSGKILFDGVDLDTISESSLRYGIAVIPQNPSLFHGTILDNIRYGRKNATKQEIAQAAQKAYINEFIAQLPKGYDSIIDPLGSNLSGGQCQRIALARLFLTRASILILDEPLSHLDATSQAHLERSLGEFMRHKTTLMVTHTSSSLLEQFDRILVFDQGEIVEQGTYRHLMLSGGLKPAVHPSG